MVLVAAITSCLLLGKSGKEGGGYRDHHNGVNDVSTLRPCLYPFAPFHRGLRPIPVSLVSIEEAIMRFGPLGITFVGTARELREALRALIALGPGDVTLVELCRLNTHR
jgi:hypothetical protein